MYLTQSGMVVVFSPPLFYA